MLLGTQNPFAGRRLPDTEEAVDGATGQETAIGTELQRGAVDLPFALQWLERLFPGLPVPDLNFPKCPVAVASVADGNQVSVRVERGG